MATDSRIMSISEQAYDKVATIVRDSTTGPELAVVIAIAGLNGSEFAYEIHMTPVDRLEPDDHVEQHQDLTLAIPAGNVENLRGATLGMSKNLLKPGLAIENPNSPSPAILGDGPPPDTSSPVAEQVKHVIKNQINPAVASHGGQVELVAVEEGIAYVRLGGACQGCGMANVTLSQGIESTILSMVPEVHTVMDVTDHAAGESPYYEASKK
ncbi:MAG: NifU family protein [Acidimicrobiia bacterium]